MSSSLSSTSPVILVADDQATTRLVLESLLQSEGYATVQASTGTEALQALARQRVDLVLLDVMLPDLDGYEVCQRIKADAKNATLPVVFVTSLGDRESRVRGKEVGGDDFLTKPIDEVELKARTRNLLRVRAYHELIAGRCLVLEDELEKIRSQLLRADRLATLGTLAGGVGHELNNILMVLLGTIEMMQEDVATGRPVAREDLEKLDRAGQHIRLHARQLLDLGRPGPEHAHSIDLRDVVRATLAMLATAGKTKRVTVSTRLPEQPVPVTVNRTRIEQVLVNLVGNAADALEGVRERKPLVQVEVLHDPGIERVTCRVIDNGSGIPADKLEAIFEPYFTTKAPGKGTGLGLPVVKSIVESYGGSLKVWSTAGQGSTFEFDLPVAVSS